jgi:murein DD-endopeptidase MepM/ murein hydrolase activator NlpD
MLKTIQSLQDRAGRYSIGVSDNTGIGIADKGSGSMFFKKRVGTEEALVRYIGARTFLVVMLVWFFGFGILGSVQVGSAQQEADFLGAADPSDFVVPEQADGAVLDLALDEPAPPDDGLFYTVYRVIKGDTISHIAERYGVTSDAIITFNDVTNARAIAIGRYLKIPNMNGILYETRKNDTLESIATTYNVPSDRIAELNGLSQGSIEAGRRLFLPDARLSNIALREINGDLFSWPIRGWITSWYGWRNDPFTGMRSFHTGIDIGSSQGTAIRAAMEGSVSAVGYSAVSGNYIILAHHSGYSTMYAHLSSIAVRTGQRVSTSTVIGAVGSTGYSTGPHLHFTVKKYGRLVNPMTLLR